MASTAHDATRSAARPTRVRYWVIFFAVTLAVFSYIDRVALSLSRKQVASDLHLTDAQMGLVFGAFALAYALFEVPSGWMGDKWGPRRVLMRIVIWWSAFTAATGMTWNFISLYLTQLLFGAGEAGCFPNITRAFSNWLPPSERVRAQGIIWLSARWGGAFTPILVAFLFQFLTWRQAFGTFGVLGLVWAVAFYVWFRDNPKEKETVNQAELDLLKDNIQPSRHGRVPWGKFLTSKTVWLLCGQYFALSFPWYFLITWAPTFIDERFHVDVTKSTMLKVLPLFMGGLGAFISGLIAAPVTKLTGSVDLTRRLFGCLGFAGACGCLILAAYLRDPFIAVSAVAFSSFCNDLVMPTAWGTVMDVAGGYSGTLSGTMNMMGNLGGALYGPVAGMVLQRSHHNWDAVLLMGAFVYTTGILMWLAMDPTTPIDDPRAKKAHPAVPFAVIGALVGGLIYFVFSDTSTESLTPVFEALALGAIAGIGLGFWVRSRIAAPTLA
ncbi:MAG TPA: MFS transporter [Bryobacteraceae bacterium]|nr:MFS transporter [Bryobacteraceae bacterium]